MEWRPVTLETGKRERDGLGDFMVRVADGKKKRKVEVRRILCNPKGRRSLGLMVGVKVGGVE